MHTEIKKSVIAMNVQRENFSNYIPPVTKHLLIINAIMWVACIVFQHLGSRVDLINLLGLHYFLSDNFMPYQLVSYMFLHSIGGGLGNGLDFRHIFFNMFAVFMFGRTIETIWGSKKFLVYYLVTGIGAGLIQLLVIHVCVQLFPGSPPIGPNATQLYNSIAPTIGASGAVFGILLAFGMMFPNTPLYLMFIPIPIKAKYFVIGYGLIELFMGISNRPGDNVAHFAHLGGMLFGIILILYWKKKGNLYGKHSW